MLRILILILGLVVPVIASASPLDPFGGQDGLKRIAVRTVEILLSDTRIKDRFSRTNLPRLRKLLAEQFCVVLDGPCTYSGREMAETHLHLNISEAELNALVEDLQTAMDDQGIAFASQNLLIARLAPMKPDIVRP